MKGLLLTLALIIGGLSLKAQCIDTLNSPTNAACPPDFLPICGCNGVTYHNSCFADREQVLNYYDRPCEQIAMAIWPNPATFILDVSIFTKYDADVNLYIFDRNGTINYYQFIPYVSNTQLTIPVFGFKRGLYIIMAESNGVTKLLKFIKWDP